MGGRREERERGRVDTGALEPHRHVESADPFPVHVVDIAAGVGLYAETLGPLPFDFGRGPLEAATLYRVRPTTPPASGQR